jgi:acyl-coenzyme A synthetase/AMP-(fatty) acid ligase
MLDDGAAVAGAVEGATTCGFRRRLPAKPLPSSGCRLHPLYILFSSGTTGIPKCIVHSAGGTLLQHLKEHRCIAASSPASGCSTSPPAAG